MTKIIQKCVAADAAKTQSQSTNTDWCLMGELSLFQLLRVVKTVINRSFKGIWNAARPRPVWHLFVLLDLCVKIKEEPQLGLLQKESGNQFR